MSAGEAPVGGPVGGALGGAIGRRPGGLGGRVSRLSGALRGDGLKARAARASGSLFVGIVVGKAIRLASNVALTYLVAQAAFGLMQLVNVLRSAVDMFTDIGTRGSVVRSKRGAEPEFLDTAWTFRVIRGAGVSLIVVGLAWPFAALYGTGELIGPAVLVGVTALLAGFASPALMLFTKELDATRQLAVDLVSAVAAAAGMIGFALAERAAARELLLGVAPALESVARPSWFKASVYALAVGGVAGSVARVIASYAVAPRFRRPRFRLVGWAAREQVSFGRWILITTVLTFLATRGDKLLLGKLITLEELGVYGVAFGLAQMIRDVLQRVAGRVAFPAVAKKQDLPREQLRALIGKWGMRLLLPSMAALAVLAALGDAAVEFAYPESFRAAGWMLCVMSIGLVPQCLTLLTGASLMALGKPKYNAFGSMTRIAVLAAGVLLGYELFGLVGAVVATALTSVPTYAMETLGAAREKIWPWRRDAAALGVFVLVFALVTAGRLALGLGWALDDVSNDVVPGPAGAAAVAGPVVGAVVGAGG